VAEIALANHAALRVVLRHAVGTIPGAILASYASIGAVNYYARDRIFAIRFHWAADQARGFQAVVAAHREMMALYMRIVAALQFTHAPPVDRGWIAVLLVARNHAALATDTLRHVKVKAILLAWLERPLWDQRPWLRFDLDQCRLLGGSDYVN